MTTTDPDQKSNYSLSEIFSYELPQDRIAQRPVMPYDQAKLLVVRRDTGVINNVEFSDLPDLLGPKDLLVFNNSRVIPARLMGTITKTNTAAEVVLHREIGPDLWVCLGKPLRKFGRNSRLEFSDGVQATVLDRLGGREVLLKFQTPGDVGIRGLLDKIGLMPIPPYIRGGVADDQDRKDYQSMFAAHDGSIAAPTASLHFTPELLVKLNKKGISIEYVTLHVGPASFLALWDQGQDGAVAKAAPPGKEDLVFSEALLQRLRSWKAGGGRVIAVGTTVVRALESLAAVGAGSCKDGDILNTDLFIYPGFKFNLVDALVTNFHQPRTTHILLVQALLGRVLLKQSYDYALQNDFRFLSYGDGMAIF